MKKILVLLIFGFTALFFATPGKADTKPDYPFKEIGAVMAVGAMAIPIEGAAVLRYSGTQNDTIGLFFLNGEFQHYTLEDEYRPIGFKVKKETRIPAGTYKLALRQEGTKHLKYKQLYPALHKGMVHLTNVPGFEYILYHVGNTDVDTEGCLLCGDVVNNNKIGRAQLQSSTNAYLRTYPKLADYILRSPNPIIHIIDLDRLKA